MKINQYRQGDVMVSAVANIPESATEVKNEGRIVLAHGEVTGHAHAIAVEEAQEFTFADASGIVRRFLKVFDLGANLKHEEHATIPLPPTLLYLEYASTRKKCKNAKVKAAVSKQLFGEKP